MVEQATENRCVGGSIPPLGTFQMHKLNYFFLIILLFTSCKQIDENFFPYKQGMTWTYTILLKSSYTGKSHEKRLLITNIKTHKKREGVEFFRLHSNGNTYKYFVDKFNNKIIRLSALFNYGEGLTEPINREIYPDLLFEKKKWELTEQLFLTRGYQPPVRNFRPESKFTMNYSLERRMKIFKNRGITFKNCIYIVGTGSTSFIADSRSGPLEVLIKSEEWICDNIGTVLEKRYEETKASAFGNATFIKELIQLK